MIKEFVLGVSILIFTGVISGCTNMTPSTAAEAFERGFTAYEAGDYETAVKLYTQAAAQGHADAQFRLGVMYDAGAGVRENDAKAIALFTQAAAQGDTLAQFFLTRMRANYEKTPEDNTKIVRWVKLAAEQGNAKAQHYLGLMYDNGRGKAQDKIVAHMWLNMASLNGNEMAKNRKKTLEESMSEVQIAKAEEKAGQCFKNNYQNC